MFLRYITEAELYIRCCKDIDLSVSIAVLQVYEMGVSFIIRHRAFMICTKLICLYSPINLESNRRARRCFALEMSSLDHNMQKCAAFLAAGNTKQARLSQFVISMSAWYVETFLKRLTSHNPVIPPRRATAHVQL